MGCLTSWAWPGPSQYSQPRPTPTLRLPIAKQVLDFLAPPRLTWGACVLVAVEACAGACQDDAAVRPTPPTRLGEGRALGPITVFILHLPGAGEDPVGDFHPPWRSVVGPVHLALFAQLGEELRGLPGVPPHVVAVAVNKGLGSGRAAADPTPSNLPREKGPVPLLRGWEEGRIAPAEARNHMGRDSVDQCPPLSQP